MADTQRIDFDIMRTQATRIGAEALNVSSGTDAGWDGTVRAKPNPNELERQFNEQMEDYAKIFQTSRDNLSASLQKLLEGMKQAMRAYAQTEQAITASVQSEDSAMPASVAADAWSEQLDEDAKSQHETRVRYEQMEDTYLGGKTQSEFDDLVKQGTEGK